MLYDKLSVIVKRIKVFKSLIKQVFVAIQNNKSLRKHFFV